MKGSFEKEDRKRFKLKTVVIAKIFNYQPFCGVQKYIFVQYSKTIFLQIGISNFIISDTFLVVPSIINDNFENVLFH